MARTISSASLAARAYAHALELACIRHELTYPALRLDATLRGVRRNLDLAPIAAGAEANGIIRAIEEARQCTHEIIELVRRIGVAVSDVEPEPVDLAEIVHATVEIAERAVRPKTSFTTDFCVRPRVEGSRPAVRLALLELLGEVLATAMHDGSENRTVTVSIQREREGWALLTVRSNGSAAVASVAFPLLGA